MTITQSQIQDLFDYRNGNLYWKRRASPTAGAGDIAGGSDGSEGYNNINICGKSYKAHRLIFLWHHGYLPKLIDHIDGNRVNNHIENLRECTPQQNQQNRKLSKASASGHKDVYKNGNKWLVRMSVDGKRKMFGSYYDIEVAKFIAITMRNKYHGKFARHC